MKLSPAIVPLAAVLLGSILTSCSVLAPQVGVCVSWIDVSDPQTAYDESEAVVIGTLEATKETVSLYGIQAAVHELTISEVVKGDVEQTPTIRVASTPVTCTGGDTYPEGDPLDVEGEQIVFLNSPEPDGAWQLLTPYNAVLPAKADGTLPFETPAK